MMSSTKDVDESILSQARSLLPYVRANGNPNVLVQSIMDVPWILVLVFELLTTQSLADDMKRFDTFERQAHVLQMILDTLELTLKLPMSHISGAGLARLERRHLADSLQIFSDLVQHCYCTPTKEISERGESKSPEGRRLSLSHFGSPEFGEVDFSEFSTPELVTVLPARSVIENLTDNTRKNVGEPSPIVTVRPLPQSQHQGRPHPLSRKTSSGTHLPERDGNNTDFLKDNMFSRQAENSIRSNISTTLVKEVYRQRENTEKPTSDRRCDVRQEADNVDKHKDHKSLEKHHIFAPRLPSMSLLSPSKTGLRTKSMHSLNKNLVGTNKRGGHMIPKESAKLSRFSPYKLPLKPCDKIEYPLTKRVTDQPRDNYSPAAISAKMTKRTEDKYIKPATFTKRLCRKPSVKSFRSPILSTSRRNPRNDPRQSSSAKTEVIHGKVRDNISELRIRTTLGHRTSVKITKQAECIPNRSRKPSSSRFKPQSLNNGTVKKPPIKGARKPSISVKFASKGQKSSQRSRNGSVHSRQEASEFEVTPSWNEEDESFVCSPIKNKRYGNNRRRPSVVSTKARKHSLASPQSPHYTQERSSRFCRPVQKGDLSPQTTSLCTSLKLLEDFDYVKRRLKEITILKREHREAICELEREEIRLEYLLTHVQHQTARALNKGSSSSRIGSRGRPI